MYVNVAMSKENAETLVEGHSYSSSHIYEKLGAVKLEGAFSSEEEFEQVLYLFNSKWILVNLSSFYTPGENDLFHCVEWIYSSSYAEEFLKKHARLQEYDLRILLRAAQKNPFFSWSNVLEDK